MPSLDPESDCFVLRIVYDGASKAGKTTTVRALGKLLGVETQTPKEALGRTLYFDWLEYRGGRYEGRPLRCQVLTVPGQSILRKRRQRLLRDADAVVFVLDSSPEGCAAAVTPLATLRTRLAATSPPANLLVQANHRDHPQALPLDTLRQRLDLPADLPLTRTVASNAEGVRETFVFAVRLALERLTNEHGQCHHEMAKLPAEDPEKLLRELQRLELTPDTSPTEKGVSGAAAASIGPRLPDAVIPIGHIWPPVRGRKLLAEVEPESPRVGPDAQGAWVASTKRWRYHSEPDAVFHHLASGLNQLLEWAHWHSLHLSLLTPDRVLALAPDGHQKAWRLWQAVRVVTPLEAELEDAARAKDDGEAGHLLRTASRWATAAGKLPGAARLVYDAKLDLLAIVEGQARFAGFAPAHGGAPAPTGAAQAGAANALLEQIAHHTVVANLPAPTGRLRADPT